MSNHWISVEYRIPLPEDGDNHVRQEYLLWFGGDSYVPPGAIVGHCVASSESPGFRFEDSEDHQTLRNITHWQTMVPPEAKP